MNCCVRERERRSITQLHIAEELHLDARVGRGHRGRSFRWSWEPAVYARGHLRQYAALLGLSPQLIIERYEAIDRSPGSPDADAAVGASVARSIWSVASLAGPLWSGVGLIALVFWAGGCGRRCDAGRSDAARASAGRSGHASVARCHRRCRRNLRRNSPEPGGSAATAGIERGACDDSVDAGQGAIRAAAAIQRCVVDLRSTIRPANV